MAKEAATLDGSTMFRCMIVGLDEATAKECAQSVRPLVAIRISDPTEACAKMSEVLPLIVILPEALAVPGSELVDLAGACGAELVTIGSTFDRSVLGKKLLESIRKAEDRRVAR
ncbi:MAG: hypothetical protein JST00_39630 [Deltaproteobacteria bacterium]|nr:hypothetical protein [Deltaproteobacteria bacterium]